MSQARVALLLAAMDETYERLRLRIRDLTDDEFFWEPVPGCWTVYRTASGRWDYHYAIPDPDPAPATTIAWQIIHLATCKVMYHEWAFGPARLTFPDLVIPHTVRSAKAYLSRGQKLLREQLLGRSDSQLDRQVKTNWGETWPAWRIFWAMADHDALHGGAIGALRDLYYWSATRRPSPSPR
ncbi:MAG: DinB family protein [Chloroflexi bacterium]|nr:MAG: DinB family protein [Chloroflexota bacterium]TMG07091.1 MAG: DinB family protein [Chloroflexota bacterium]TMG68364.1 MAG: DinB family protein [Chloroflexota bacterium]